MKRLQKLSLVGLLAFALVAGMGVNSAQAALTVAALAVTSDGALTLSSSSNTADIVVGTTTMTTGDTTIYGGTGVGAITFTPGTAGTIVMGKTDGTGAITLGSSSGTQNVSIAAGEGATTVAIAGGATNAKTVQIGIGAVANTITIGSASATTVSIVDNNWSVTAAGVATFVNGLVSPSATLGVDVGSAGNLQLGGVTATSVGIGSAVVTAITLATDGTGTAEVVLPAGSIDSTEILDATILAADFAAGAVDTAAILDATVASVDMSAGAKTHTVIILIPDPGAADADITAGYVLWTPSVAVTITKVYTGAQTDWVAAAAANNGEVVVSNAAVGAVATLAVVTNLATGSNTDMGAITNGAVVAGTDVTIAVTTNGTANAPAQNIQIEYTTTN